MRNVAELLAALPEHVSTFEGTEYPLPLCQAVLGEIPNVTDVREMLESAAADEVGDFAVCVALAAECYEAGQQDARELFVPDSDLRGLVFRGGKWRAGWAFVLGDVTAEFRAELEEREFIVLESKGRPTYPVYWLQMMVRYAMTWGQIPPGDDHEMSHYLEEDLPGVLIVRGATSEIESLLAVAAMKLGCPAVVPDDFPFEEGRQARVRSDREALDAIATLPNLRVKEVGGERVSLPRYCDAEYAREPFEAARTLGGEHGFFVLQPADVKSGVEIVGTPGDSLGILIQVGDDRLDVITSDYLERTAAQLPGYLPGVRVVSVDPFALGLAEGAELAPDRLAAVLQRGLKWHFPKLRDIHVRILLDPSELAALGPAARKFRGDRAQAVSVQTEQNVDHFVACIECQPFSHSHVCIITPGRPPMCGRDVGQVRAAALFGATWHPYRRRGLSVQELRELIPKGRCIDSERGEYEGVNQAAHRLTDGRVQRVFLHSLDGSPHTSCGCFHYLAFRIEGCGIGLMHRGFSGRAPNGETWDTLANQAGGKQADGVAGLSAGYLSRAEFLKADGGLAAVVWSTRQGLEEMRDFLPPDKMPATEDDVQTLQELRRFLSRRG